MPKKKKPDTPEESARTLRVKAKRRFMPPLPSEHVYIERVGEVVEESVDKVPPGWVAGDPIPTVRKVTGSRVYSIRSEGDADDGQTLTLDELSEQFDPLTIPEWLELDMESDLRELEAETPDADPPLEPAEED